MGNTIVGVLGGGIGEQILAATGLIQGSSAAGNIAGSGVGGAILMIIVGVIKNAMAMK